jgi:hypothetical protein
MNLVDRAKNLFVTPKTEWDVIAAETTAPAQLVTGYVLPLAAIAAVAAFIGAVVIGTSVPLVGTVRSSVVGGLVGAVMQVVMSVVFVFVMGFIIDALAPTFGGQKNMAQAVKVSAYSYTPVWVLSILAIIPYLGVLVSLVAMVFAIYLLYLGLPRVMRAPPDKGAGYTVLVVVVGVVVGFLVGFVISLATMPFHMMGAGAGRVSIEGNETTAKLDEFARKMEEASKKMEAAQKSGDSNAQAEAAMAVLGTALSGGKGVDPVQPDQLKTFVPEKVAGLARTDLRTERSGVKGLMTAKAEASYGEGDRNLTLEIVDTGGAAGLVGMASFMGVQGEREDAQRREATRKEGNRLVHEEQDKQGGSSKYTVVLADRFVVSAEGNGVDFGTLKSAVHGVNLSGIEGLK